MKDSNRCSMGRIFQVGRDLWKILSCARKMKPAELAKKQIEANKKVTGNWSVKDGCIWFNGAGDNLCSIKEYGDFEMLVDWKITKKGDSGIYLRGSPQVQIWDTSRVEVGAQVGSGDCTIIRQTWQNLLRWLIIPSATGIVSELL